MVEDLSDAQKSSIDQQSAMFRALAALPGVSRHDTRFANEIALKAPATSMGELKEIVEAQLGPAVGADVSTDPMARALGGMRPEQTLYRQEIASGLWLYVAFWPWSSGQTVTIKVGHYEAG